MTAATSSLPPFPGLAWRNKTCPHNRSRFFAEARTKNLWVSFSHDDKVAAGRLAQGDGKTARLEETIGIRTS